MDIGWPEAFAIVSIVLIVCSALVAICYIDKKY